MSRTSDYIERSNYYRDPRVIAAEEGDRYVAFDEKRMRMCVDLGPCPDCEAEDPEPSKKAREGDDADETESLSFEMGTRATFHVDSTIRGAIETRALRVYNGQAVVLVADCTATEADEDDIAYGASVWRVRLVEGRDVGEYILARNAELTLLPVPALPLKYARTLEYNAPTELLETFAAEIGAAPFKDEHGTYLSTARETRAAIERAFRKGTLDVARLDPHVCETCAKRAQYVWVDAVYEVCDLCQGRGSHVNPSIDCGGLTREDFDEDPDFAESYFEGHYDVDCNQCHGKRVVPVLAGTVDPSILKVLDERARDEAAFRAEQRAERIMGA